MYSLNMIVDRINAGGNEKFGSGIAISDTDIG